MPAFLHPALLIPPRRQHVSMRCSPRVTAAAPVSARNIPPQVHAVAERLRSELPTLFDDPATADYSLYTESVTFEDPLNRFRGVSRYVANIKFLKSSPVFSNGAFFLYDIRVIGLERSIVRTRWALQMVANLPWKPCVAFSGQSDYLINPAGKVFKHIDYWDSLRDSSFFSVPAIFDLARQCKPGKISPLDLGGFQLLRRTPLLEVRNFETEQREGVVLKPTHRANHLQQWSVVPEGTNTGFSCVVKLAAVKTLVGPPSAASLDRADRQLRAELASVDYATAGKNSRFVKSVVRGRTVFEMWVELINANADVDE